MGLAVAMGFALPGGAPLLLSCVPDMRPLYSVVMLWRIGMPLVVSGGI